MCLTCPQTDHISHKAFWTNAAGERPPDFTVLHIQDEEIKDEKGNPWMPEDEKMMVRLD